MKNSIRKYLGTCFSREILDICPFEKKDIIIATTAIVLLPVVFPALGTFIGYIFDNYTLVNFSIPFFMVLCFSFIFVSKEFDEVNPEFIDSNFHLESIEGKHIKYLIEEQGTIYHFQLKALFSIRESKKEKTLKKRWGIK